MANTPQARKRARQAVNRRTHNMALRSRMRTMIKKVIAAIQAGKADEAKSAYETAVPEIDKMATKGIIHQNKAARHKSRLNQQIKGLK